MTYVAATSMSASTTGAIVVAVETEVTDMKTTWSQVVKEERFSGR